MQHFAQLSKEELELVLGVLVDHEKDGGYDDGMCKCPSCGVDDAPGMILHTDDCEWRKAYRLITGKLYFNPPEVENG